jgi:hypothetical protein
MISSVSVQEAITASKQYLPAKDYAWQHGQFQLDTRRGITYLMDFEVRLVAFLVRRKLQMHRRTICTDV